VTNSIKCKFSEGSTICDTLVKKYFLQVKTFITKVNFVQDIQALEMGDLTVVGSRGNGLSGGQKARISLARAAYRENCAVMLLDDPLGAVDPAVATLLFDSCICGYMNNKVGCKSFAG